MTLIGHRLNDYGTRVSVHFCQDCGNEYTVCPAREGNHGGCLGVGCDSYDINRDVDAKLFFGAKLKRRPCDENG